MRIGIECHNLENQRWGIGRNLEKLLSNIVQFKKTRPELIKGLEFFLYFRSFIPDDDFLKDPIFKCRVLKFIRPSFNIFYHILIPLQYKKDKLDGIFFPGYMLPPLFKGKSLVTLTNDAYYEFKYGVLPWRYRLSYGLFSKWAAKKATKITTYSGFAKNELMKIYGIKPERISVNPLGVEFRDELGIKSYESGENNSKYLLYVGQAFPRRRVLESIVGFSKIAKKYQDINFIVVGKDKYKKPVLKELVNFLNKKLGRERIIYKDYVSNEELIEFYKKALAMVYISSSEAFGLPPIEILQYKVPSLMKKPGPGPEIFGENAFYIENETNIDEIARIMSEVIEDKEKRSLIAKKSQEIIKKFNWPNHTEKFITTIKELN